MFNKYKFDRYVSTQPVVNHHVYDKDFSIELSMNEIQNRGFSHIFAQYVNEGRAVIDGNYGYLEPGYYKYTMKNRNYSLLKLWQYVTDKEFILMINDSYFVMYSPIENKESNYYFEVSQDSIRKHKCMDIVALLIDDGLAVLDGSTNCVYIRYDYMENLAKSSKLQRDLSGFRILLGETSNLNRLIDLIENGTIKDGKLHIAAKDVQKKEFILEMLSLENVGLAKIIEDKSETAFVFEEEFYSWLLEYISNTSDRISFGDLFTI